LASIERERVPSPRPIAGREIPLIDRVEEMKLLKEAVDRTIQGEGGLVFLYGEAGIGKTRLARELRAYAHLRGVQVLYGRCPALFRMNGVPPYILWREVIRDYLETSNPEQLYRVIGFYPAEVAKLVPELGQKLRTIPQSFQIDPEQEQNRLFEAVSQFITNIAREAPLVVVLDDLQWTDPSSLLLLHYMARGVQKTPLLLLGAYRSTDIDAKHPLTPVLTELNRERLPQSIQLKRMSLNDVSEMIKSMLEQDDVPAEFCKLVYEKTRGNPFFAEEVVRSLKEEEVIYHEGDKWKVKEVSKIEFPETVKNVIKARLDRLDEESQDVLTLASFVGNDFTLEVMCALTGIEENKLLELMDKMLKTGLIKEREIHGEGVCSFADILVRDVVYESVSLLKRKKLHGVVGCALEKVYAKKIDEHLGELASHFLEGGDKDKALDYFLKAGDKAAKIYANAEATSYFQSALRLLEEKEGEFREKGRVLEKLGDIKKLVGEYDACLKYWTDGLLMWGYLDERGDISRLHRKVANVLWEDTGDAEKAKVHHEKALKILEAEPESVELASLFEDMARMYGRTESMDKALNWAEKALELAKKLNDYGVIASSYDSLGTFTLATSGDWKKAVECHEKALKIALDNGLTETAIQTYDSLGTALPWQEQERSVDCFEKGFELAKKVGAIRWVSLLGTILAGLYCLMGINDKAVLLAEESVALDRKTGNMPNLSFSLSTLGSVYLVLGEWDKSEKYLTEALNLSRTLDQYGRIAWSSIDLSILYGMYKGDLSKARGLLEGAIGILEKAGAKLGQMVASSYLVWMYVELGMLQEANDLLNVVQKFFLEINEEGSIAWAEALRGMELRAQKKWEESIEHFEKSRREFEHINARRWMTFSFAKFFLCEYARVYLERDQEGDREKAHNLLGQALEIFQKIGAKKEIEKTIKLIEVLQPPHTQIREGTVSSESLEYADVQSKIIASPRELKIGESLELEIELTNTCKKGAILLIKITEVIPEGFAIVKKPEVYRVEGNCLNMKEKRLDPSMTEEVKLVLTPKIQGTFHIKPKILYVDADCKEKTHEPKPTIITVKELGIKGWLKGER
jgi:tetratricopeptide (TPR) repeat protein